MRKLLLIGLVLGFVQCQSNSGVAPSDTLEGRWVWIQSTGGFAGTTNTPASTHQTIELEFTTDQHQRVYIDGQLSSDMTYHIIRDTSISTGQPTDMIEYDSSSPRSTYRFDKGDLILFDECYDCFTSIYSRKTTGAD